MKTKNKILAIVEIAVVLCSVFLVAIPAIATEQNQEMQKAITTASEDDSLPLGIYGNANEDDTIDMGDVVYTKLAIFGKKPKTTLCDAKYDGWINVLDVIQTKLIILGKEKEITIVQHSGWKQLETQEPATVPKPVERIVVLYMVSPELLRILNAGDKIVGVSSYIKKSYTAMFPEISKLPSVGGFVPDLNIDYEAILNLNPDVLLPFGASTAQMREKLPGVAVVYLGDYYPNIINPEKSPAVDGVRQLGYILDKEEEAEEYANWLIGWANEIKSRTEGLSEDERPLVMCGRPKLGTNIVTVTPMIDTTSQMCLLAGGKNILENLPELFLQRGVYTLTVDTEWVIEQNPEFIVIMVNPPALSCGADDPSEAAAVREDVLNNPVFANVNAIKTGNVYIYSGDFRNDLSCGITGAAYMAKVFYPDLFEDLDPEAVHQEYLEFQHFDYDLDEHGIFFYPPIITGEGKLAGIPDRYYDSIVAQP